MPRRIIIDTDPGLDDAVAILLALAAPCFSVAAVTTLAGNIGLDRTTRNAAGLLAAMGRADIPHAAGAARPLTADAISEEAIHGDDGLGGVMLPAPLAAPADAAAHDLMAQMLDAAPAGAIDILALGPLTNLALLVKNHPGAAARIGRLVAMGGAVATHGNVGTRSEFNFAFDPEAAATVLASGLPLTLIPLDVTRKVRADRAFLERLTVSGTKAANLSARLIAAYFADAVDRSSRPLHDPCVMLYAMRPDLFATRAMKLAVDLDPAEDRGALVMSDRGAMVEIAIDVEAQPALDLLAGELTRTAS